MKKNKKSIDIITFKLYNGSADSQQVGAVLVKTEKFSNIYEHEKFKREFEDTVLEGDVNGKYHQWLKKMLGILDSKGHAALSLPHFESIKESTLKIKSIRYPNTQRNPRVLFCFLDNKIMLLHCFRESSKSEGSEYKRGVKIAESRISEIKGQ